MKLGNVGIAARLQILAVVAIASLLVLAASGAYVAQHLRSSVDYIYRNTLPSIDAIETINEDFLRLRLAVLYHFLNKEAAKKQTSDAQITALKDKIRQGLARYEKELVSDATDKAMLEKEKSYFETYFTEIEPALERSRALDEAGIWDGVAKATKNMTALNEAIDAHKKYNTQLAENYIRVSESTDRRGQFVAIALIIASLLVVGGLSVIIIREIRTRMGRLSGMMNQVNDTLDFTVRIPITRMDELGHSADAFNRLIEKLQTSLRSIAESTRSVAAAADEMNTTSGHVATASQQQAAAASDMAATVEELTVSINHVADRAGETSRLARESGEVAGRGEHVIADTSTEIHEIASTVGEAGELIHSLESNSQQIANVLQVIRDVAEQTNLLALNAAIEAARAGEQGRGFAVVADEVRKLAERTATSTQEIAKTIDAMRTSASDAVASMTTVNAKVKSGVDKAQEANQAMQQIGGGARCSIGMVEEIAEAIREQGAATNNIASQVERIAQMSEESSAAAANSAEAANALDQLAKDMQRIVSAYRLA
ncbi:methyl-accepting chemotaxis protein [uncultured Propionivibrio sp.]|uniref:methyl-accepting chemotaxis protein n=1 Tax=uncultured Propionivibrio sp. TaxID=426737 RepID=UPI0029C089DD|nr:methyl-accepting chemotaxis protein [uncultured Propionivibrio sp.]